MADLKTFFDEWMEAHRHDTDPASSAEQNSKRLAAIFKEDVRMAGFNRDEREDQIGIVHLAIREAIEGPGFYQDRVDALEDGEGASLEPVLEPSGQLSNEVMRNDPTEKWNHSDARELGRSPSKSVWQQNSGENAMASFETSAPAETNGLEDLFLDALKDIYYAEQKIAKALPKMAASAESEDVTAAFEKHLMETEGQIGRLEQVFELMGEEPQGKECPAIDGILKEGDEILEEYEGLPALDAGLVAAAQAVEHYEMARYGTLIAWAGKLGISEAADLLSATLQEETATDEALTALGETASTIAQWKKLHSLSPRLA